MFPPSGKFRYRISFEEKIKSFQNMFSGWWFLTILEVILCLKQDFKKIPWTFFFFLKWLMLKDGCDIGGFLSHSRMHY